MKVTEGSGVPPAPTRAELPDTLFGTVFRASPIAMAVTRMLDSTFIAVNEVFCRLTGYPPDQLVGRSALDLGLWADPADRADMVRMLRERGSVTNLTATFRTGSGRTRSGAFSVKVIEDRGERCLLTTVSDVTERIWAEQAARVAEEQLREAEAKYRTLVENMPAIAYVESLDTDPEGFYMSPQVRDILGYDPEDFRDPAFWGRHIHPEDRERVLAEDGRANRTHERFDSEYRFIAADRRTVWIRDEAVPVKNDEGRPLFWQGLLLDVTEQKAMEDQLRRAEARYRSLVEQIPAITYTDLVDDELTTIFVSPQVETVLGLSQADWIDDPDLWRKFLHPDDRERAVEEYVRARDTGAPFTLEYRMVTPEGRVVWIREQGVTLTVDRGGTRLVQGLMYDVTDQKEAEEAARAAETKYRTLVENIPAITYLETNDPEPVAFYMSPQVETILGYAPEDFRDPAFWGERIHPDDRAHALAEESHSNTTGEPYGHEYRMLAADGRTVWIRDEAVLARDEKGEPLYWQGVLIDVTQQKEAERRLREAEVRYRTLVENMPAITYVEGLDPDAPEFYISPQVEGILGYAPEAWSQDPRFWYGLIHPDDVDRVRAANEQSNATRTPYGVEYRLIANDGRVVWVRDVAVLMGGGPDGRQAWQGVVFDVTALKEAEAELQRSLDLLRRSDEERRRLLARVVQAQEEERRRIAADIHDDSIQKMAAVGLRLQTLHRHDLGPEEQRLLEQLERTVELSIARLRRMMFELRPPALDRDGLAAALHQHLEEMAEDGGFDAHLEDRLVTEPPGTTRAIAYRIAQEALANVRKHADARRVDVLLEPREEGLLVRIRDDGRGFDRDEASPPGVHVGLSAMRERAELAGGWCRVDSARGTGTKVEFWLPYRPEDPAEGG